MRSIYSVLTIAGLVAASTATIIGTPAMAHHSFGHYAIDKTADIEGIVSKFEWSNPHCWLFVDVASANGAPVTYGFELQSVGELLRRGWKKTTVKPGDKLKVKFRPMRNGSPSGLLMIAEKDGKVVGNFIPGAPTVLTPPAAPK